MTCDGAIPASALHVPIPRDDATFLHAPDGPYALHAPIPRDDVTFPHAPAPTPRDDESSPS